MSGSESPGSDQTPSTAGTVSSLKPGVKEVAEEITNAAGDVLKSLLQAQYHTWTEDQGSHPSDFSTGIAEQIDTQIESTSAYSTITQITYGTQYIKRQLAERFLSANLVPRYALEGEDEKTVVWGHRLLDEISRVTADLERFSNNPLQNILKKVDEGNKGKKQNKKMQLESTKKETEINNYCEKFKTAFQQAFSFTLNEHILEIERAPHKPILDSTKEEQASDVGEVSAVEIVAKSSGIPELPGDDLVVDHDVHPALTSTSPTSLPAKSAKSDTQRTKPTTTSSKAEQAASVDLLDTQVKNANTNTNNFFVDSYFVRSPSAVLSPSTPASDDEHAKNHAHHNHDNSDASQSSHLLPLHHVRNAHDMYVAALLVLFVVGAGCKCFFCKAPTQESGHRLAANTTNIFGAVVFFLLFSWFVKTSTVVGEKYRQAVDFCTIFSILIALLLFCYLLNRTGPSGASPSNEEPGTTTSNAKHDQGGTTRTGKKSKFESKTGASEADTKPSCPAKRLNQHADRLVNHE
ncbi:unnamed protein product [Amoebophrya sp. A120]|nr:unnamed protein product [Amoebophrya sp. A120]|eukprot:GSA120T00008620001.1